MTKYILIITNNPDSLWVTTVREALSPLGQVLVILETEVLDEITARNYDLILIDASSIETETAVLINPLHLSQPFVPIVVNTTSPTWRRARDAFMAGAADYVRRTLDKDKILAECQDFLEPDV